MSKRSLILLFSLVVGLGLLVYLFSRAASSGPNDCPELTSPVLAREVVKTWEPVGSLFLSPAGIDAVKELTGWEIDDSPERRALVLKAIHAPLAWRALDRKERFELVWLVGDPAEYRPLLDHLIRSKDWVLAGVDPTSFLFRRQPAQAWEEAAQLAALKERFQAHPAQDRVWMRVLMAHRLSAIGRLEPAGTLLDEATEIDPESARAWAQRSILFATMGRWNQALEASEKAIALEGDYLPALSAHAHALYAHGKAREALALTRRLVVELPNDGQTLFLHAKVTHAAKAFQEEAEVLEAIIEQSRASGLPLGSWQVYLGQAYSRLGEAQKAIEAFEAALADPTLAAREREFAEKGLERIRP